MMEHVIGAIRALAQEAELPDHLVTSAIKPEDTLETLGLDSLGAMLFIERLEAKLDIRLPDDFLDFSDTLAGIAHRLDIFAHKGAIMQVLGSSASPEANGTHVTTH